MYACAFVVAAARQVCVYVCAEVCVGDCVCICVCLNGVGRQHGGLAGCIVTWWPPKEKELTEETVSVLPHTHTQTDTP